MSRTPMKLVLVFCTLAATLCAQRRFLPNDLIESSVPLNDVVLVDIQGDGVDEFIACSPDARLLRFISDQNAPTGYTIATFTTVIGARRLVSADFDGDGFQDVVVSGQSTQNTVIVLHRGDAFGQFSAPEVIDSHGGVNSSILLTEDLSGDGRPDIIITRSVATTSSTVMIRIIPNDMTGFGAPTEYAGDFVDVAFGDVDSDGTLDMAAIDRLPASQYEAVMFLGDGTGAFAPPTSLIPGSIQSPDEPVLQFADLDHSGDVEVIMATSNSIRRYVGSPGAYQLVSSVDASAAGDRYRRLGIADVDNDGHDDVVLAEAQSSVEVLHATGDGLGGLGNVKLSVPANRIETPTSLRPGFVLRDMNRDGRLDMVLATRKGLEIMRHRDDGGFGDINVTTTLPEQADRLVTADFDADGKSDVLAIDSTTGTLTAGFGGADLSLENLTAVGTVGGSLFDVGVGDIDGDGDDDIVTHDTLTSALFRVFLSNGNRTFSEQVSVETGTAGAVSLIDVTGDGHLDLIFLRNAGTSNIAELRVGAGDGTFGPPSVILTVSFLHGRPLVGDFDGDGNQDVAVTDGADIHVALGAGDGTFAQSSTGFGANYDIEGAAAVDLDGDGTDEVIYFDEAGGQLLVFEYPNYTAPLAAPLPVPTAGLANIDLTATDLDQDGDAEILFPFLSHLIAFDRESGGTETFELFDLGTETAAGGDVDGDGVDEIIVDTRVAGVAVVPVYVTTRGSSDDFALESAANDNMLTRGPVKSASIYDPMTLEMSSPFGAFDGAPAGMFAQVLLGGQEPIPFSALPDVLLDPTAPFPPLELLYVANLPAGGVQFSTQLPPQALGLSIYIQAYAFGLAARNGLYAATDRHAIDVVENPFPRLDSVSDLFAPEGATVTHQGRGFEAGASLTVGNILTTPASRSSSSMTFTVPAGAACAGHVTVTNPNGSSAQIPFNPMPTLTLVTHSSGPVTGGQTVAISGQNFSPAAEVLFGGHPASSYVIRTPFLIIVRTPPGTVGEVGLRVVQPSGCVEDVPYEYLP